MKIRLIELFIIFFRISIILIGGGYVLLPISIDEFSKKRQLLTKEEIINFYALSQCLPGVIVVKTATFIGYHLRGVKGAIASSLGLIIPPFFAILTVAYFLSSGNEKIIEIVNTVTIAVIVLVGASFIELAGVCIKNIYTTIIFILTVLLFLLTNLQPVTIILIVTALGMLSKYISYKFNGESK